MYTRAPGVSFGPQGAPLPLHGLGSLRVHVDPVQLDPPPLRFQWITLGRKVPVRLESRPSIHHRPLRFPGPFRPGPVRPWSPDSSGSISRLPVSLGTPSTLSVPWKTGGGAPDPSFRSSPRVYLSICLPQLSSTLPSPSSLVYPPSLSRLLNLLLLLTLVLRCGPFVGPRYTLSPIGHLGGPRLDSPGARLASRGPRRAHPRRGPSDGGGGGESRSG